MSKLSVQSESFWLKPKRGQAATTVCKVIAQKGRTLLTNLYCFPEVFKPKGIFFEHELVQRGQEEVSADSLGEEVTILGFHQAVTKFFDFQTRAFDVARMTEERVFFCRYAFNRKRLEFAGSPRDRCSCANPDIAATDIYQHTCGQIFHSTCFDRDSRDCFNCRPTIALSKRENRDGFDFSDFAPTNKMTVEAPASRKSIDTRRPEPAKPILIEDSPPKTIFSQRDRLLARLRVIRLDTEPGEKMRSGIRDTLFALLFDTFAELQANRELADPDLASSFERVSKLKEEQLFDHLVGAADKLEAALFNRHGGVSTKHSHYTDHAKALLHYLRRPPHRALAERLLVGAITAKSIIEVDPSSFIDSQLKAKIEKTQEKFLTDREAQNTNILIKTTKGEILVDPEEAQRHAAVAEAAVVEIVAKKPVEVGVVPVISSPFDGRDFREKLRSKIADMLAPDTATALQEHLDNFE